MENPDNEARFSTWLPYVEDPAQPGQINYLATDNTSLLWFLASGGDGSVRLADHGLSRAYELAESSKDSLTGGQRALRNFINTLVEIPAVGQSNLLVFSREPVRDIADDQYILAERRLKEQVAGDNDGDSADDGTRDIQAEHAAAGKPAGRYVVCTTNLAGILHNRPQSGNGDGQIQLSISSRFSKSTDGHPVPLWEDQFLAYMVERVLHINLLHLDFNSNPEDAWKQLLIWMFPLYLHAALGKGIYRKYVRHEYNDSHPRGRIDVARHVRENTPFLGNVAYSRREYDADNPVTELIRHTVEYIAGKGQFGANVLGSSPMAINDVRMIRQITPRYAPYDCQAVVSENIRRPVQHAYYQEYLALQHLCIEILGGRGLNPKKTPDDSVHGVLFDCAWLWEEYMNQVLQGIIDCNVIHPRNKEDKANYHLLYNSASGRMNGAIYPDFLLEHGDAVMVADAKYKPEGNILGGDYSQVLAYMMRFEAATGLYLHPYVPRSTGSDTGTAISETTLHVPSGINGDDRTQLQKKQLSKIGLNVSIWDANGNEVPDYASYCELMLEREQELQSRVTARLGSV